jgi:hypothetical protein
VGVVPLHAPPHRRKTYPFAGAAVSVTAAPATNVAVQSLPHPIPAGRVRMRPRPCRETASVNVATPPGAGPSRPPAWYDRQALVETPHAIVAAEAPPELLAELDCANPKNQEHRDYVRVENDAWSQRHRIGDIPMVVISNDYGRSFEGEEQRTNVEDQKGWLVLSPQARQVVVTSGHDVAGNEPGLVIREILRVLDAARAS